MIKHIIRNSNKNLNQNIIKNYNKNNLFKRSLCNLALNNYYDNYDNYDNDDNNEDLFIEKIKYDNKKKYFSITKQPYYLDEDYIKKIYFEKLKKINIICESSGSKCFKCNDTGYILNNFKYDLCPLCNRNGIY